MWCDQRGTLHSIDVNDKQVLLCKNHKGVLKGLHKSPYSKTIHVLSGKIYDFYTDGKEFHELVLDTGQSVHIPANFMHGFYCIEDSEIVYILDGHYDKETDCDIYWNSPEFKFKFDFDKENPNISKKDRLAFYSKQYTYLVVGNGFLGKQFKKYHQDDTLVVNTRLENIDELKSHIHKSKCEIVICAAGISGKPTIDWCDANEYETYKSNFLGVLNLVELCKEQNKQIIIFGSGSVYSKPGIYSECDTPDFYEKKYCKWRCKLEDVLSLYDNVTYLRIIYPCSFDGDEKCFSEKMKNRHPHKGSRVPITNIPLLFPQIKKLRDKYGIFNFVEKGTRPLESFTNLIPIEGASRGNFELDVKKLEDAGFQVNRDDQDLST